MNLQRLSNMGKDMFVGLDIGGTKTAVLVVNQALNVKSRYVMETDVSNPDSLVEGVVAAVNCALEIAKVSQEQILAIGAGMPGRVIPETGEVATAVNLNLDLFPFGEVLSSVYGVQVVLENDVRAAALGSFQWMRRRAKIKHMAYLSIGTGISAGFVLDGKLHRGASGMAGEIGHVIFEPEGTQCRCGAYGCLEAVASGPAIARQWQELNSPSENGLATAKDVYKAADQGEPAAENVIRRTSQFLARAIQMIIMLYDVEKVVLGGGVTGAGASFLTPVLSALAHIRAESSLANEMLPESKVTMLAPGSDAPTWGAINLALQAL